MSSLLCCSQIAEFSLPFPHQDKIIPDKTAFSLLVRVQTLIRVTQELLCWYMMCTIAQRTKGITRRSIPFS